MEAEDQWQAEDFDWIDSRPSTSQQAEQRRLLKENRASQRNLLNKSNQISTSHSSRSLIPPRASVTQQMMPQTSQHVVRPPVMKRLPSANLSEHTHRLSEPNQSQFMHQTKQMARDPQQVSYQTSTRDPSSAQTQFHPQQSSGSRVTANPMGHNIVCRLGDNESFTYRDWYNSIKQADGITLEMQEIFPAYIQVFDKPMTPAKHLDLMSTRNVDKFGKFVNLIRSAAEVWQQHESSATDQSTIQQSLTQLFHENKISQWKLQPFVPKDDEYFRVGEFLAYIEDFKAYAKTYDCNQRQMLHALRFESGETIAAVFRETQTDVASLSSFQEAVNIITRHWKQEKNQLHVEGKFRAMKRNDDESCVQFIRRLQRYSINVTNLSNYIDPIRATEDMILATLATGFRDVPLQKSAEALFSKPTRKGQKSDRIDQIMAKAVATDQIVKEEMGIVAKVESRRQIADPAEFKRLNSSKRKRDDSENVTRTSSSAKPRCRKCGKMHNTDVECPRCRKCNLIGHFEYQTEICQQSAKPQSQARHLEKLQVSKPEIVKKIDDEPKVSSALLDSSDDEKFY